MSEENIQNRDEVLTTLQLRNSTASQYESAKDKIPLAGEAVVYLPDETQPTYTKIKIGDGKTPLSQLKFIGDDLRDLIDHDDSDTQEQLGILLDWKEGVEDDVSSVAGLKVSVSANSAKLETLSNFKNGDYEGISGLKSLVNDTKATVDTLSSIGGDVAGVLSEVTKTNAKVETLANHVMGEYIVVVSLNKEESPEDHSTIYYDKTTEVYYYYNSETQAFNYVSSFPEIPVLDTTKVYYVNGTGDYWYYKTTEGSETGTWASTKKPYEAGLLGSFVSIKQQADDNSAKLAALAEWKGDTGESLAGYISTATEGFATIEQFSSLVDQDGNIKEAKIQTTVRKIAEDVVSEIDLSADYVTVNGFTAFKNTVNSTLDNTLIDTKIDYALSTSSATFSPVEGNDGTWQTKPPTWRENTYMWQRIGVKKANNEDYSYSQACIQGAKGTAGTGIQIKGTAYINEEFTEGNSYTIYSDKDHKNPITDAQEGDCYMVQGFLFVYSTEKKMFTCIGKFQAPTVEEVYTQYYIGTEAPDGNSEWRDQPSIVKDNQMWTREVYVMSDGTTIYTSPVQDLSYTNIANWCDANETTLIDGAHIATGTIDTVQLHANAITSEKLAVDAITSRNYWAWSELDQERYETGLGMSINLEDGTISSYNFQLSSTGIITARGANINGIITATSGNIGGWKLTPTALYKYGTTEKIINNTKYYENSFGLQTPHSSGKWVISVGDLCDTDWGQGKFRVEKDGTMYSKKGYIAKYEITDTYICSRPSNNEGPGQDDTVFLLCEDWRLRVAGTVRDDWRFTLGSNFGVTKNGEVFAVSGKLGQWTLTDTSINCYNDSKKIGTGLQVSTNGSVYALAVGYTDQNNWATAPFRVRHNGDVEISGQSRIMTLTDGGIYFSDSSGSTLGQVYLTHFGGSLGDYYKLCISTNGHRLSIGKVGTTNNELLGTWNIQQSSTDTPEAIKSDRNKKHDIEYLDDRYDVFFNNLSARRFIYNDGTSNRYHSGYIAQEIQDALNISNISEKEFAGLCTLNDDEGDYMALRYDEFVPLNTWQIQKLKAKNSELENRINILEAELASLKDK